MASQITGTRMLILDRSHNLFPWWSVSVVTVNSIHSCHSIWSYRSIYRNAQGSFNLRSPCCYRMSPLTSALILLTRRDFLFWESATECQTSPWGQEGPPTRDSPTFTNLISSHQRFENNASFSQALFQEGARKHDAKQSLPAKGAIGAVIMHEQHERTSETQHHPATRWREAALHSNLTCIISQGRRSSGEWNQEATPQCAKDGKVNRQTLFLCLVRASPTQLAANIYTQWLHEVSWMLFCFCFCFKIKQPSISKEFRLIPNISKFQNLRQYTYASKWEIKIPYESGRWFTRDGNWTWRWKGNKTMVRSSTVRGVGTWLLVPKIILEGEMRVKMKGDHGDFPQLGKVYAWKDFFNVILTWVTSHCDSWKEFSCFPSPPKLFPLTVALVFWKSSFFLPKKGDLCHLQGNLGSPNVF